MATVTCTQCGRVVDKTNAKQFGWKRKWACMSCIGKMDARDKPTSKDKDEE